MAIFLRSLNDISQGHPNFLRDDKTPGRPPLTLHEYCHVTYTFYSPQLIFWASYQRAQMKFYVIPYIEFDTFYIRHVPVYYTSVRVFKLHLLSVRFKDHNNIYPWRRMF
jgi:hypothetical protein